MKKSTVAILLAAAMTCAMGTTAFAAPELEFEPNADYEKWCAIDYTIEDIGAEMVVTVSAMEDDSKVDLQCNFYGDDQHVVAEKDGDGWKILEDKTGFMQTDTPIIIAKALEEGEWAKMGEEPAASETADDEKAVVKLPVEPEFEPNREDYDKYTAFDYTIEDIGAEMVVTISSNEDESKMEILCNFYGDDQKVVAEKDGDEWKILEDKTGFMQTDTPLMIEKAQEQNIWLPTDEEEEAKLLAGAADDAQGETASAGELPVEPEFDPNKEYDKYTAFDYTIEDIGAEMVVTISSNEDESKMEILCNFYGDDQKVVAEKDGDNWKILEDKTGFMQTDTPLMIEKAQEQNIWLPIEK